MNPTTSQQPYTIQQTGLPVQLQGPVVPVQTVQMPPAANQQPYTIPLPGQAVQVSVVPAAQTMLTNEMKKYMAIILKLSITEISLGVIILILDIATLIVAVDFGQGIWCGAFLIASGIVGVVTRSQPSYCMFNTNIALSILAAAFMVTLVILSSIFAASYSYYTYYYWGSAALGLQVTIVVLAFTGLVIAIIHCVYSCACVCKCNSRGQNQMITNARNGQVIVGPNQTNQPAVYLAPGYQYVNPAMVVPIAPNQQPVFSNPNGPNVMVQPGPVEHVPEQRPEDTQSPPSYSQSATK